MSTFFTLIHHAWGITYHVSRMTNKCFHNPFGSGFFLLNILQQDKLTSTAKALRRRVLNRINRIITYKEEILSILSILSKHSFLCVFAVKTTQSKKHINRTHFHQCFGRYVSLRLWTKQTIVWTLIYLICLICLISGWESVQRILISSWKSLNHKNHSSDIVIRVLFLQDLVHKFPDSRQSE